ncbi:cytochrome C assembly family protein [Thiomicrorhabdus xiamenensis]|uniref:Cytochrome c biogenesis protein CcsA n=1 Tax=Thiomicrorhabdus xiamenensis TaxID=2739063 RepID=A0A7D4T1N4_9GAMM|nr:cytochrome c biogenesis protein CcsA [Thiomicrorhabdus xiamenensis]QKI89725.1 cytochrome c biogenesis protein CcsA [Thiomicrorhabdus xiamenensis]
MILSGFSALIASILYLFVSLLIWRKIRFVEKVDPGYQRKHILLSASLAAVLHLFSLSQTLWQGYFVFNFANALSMITLLATMILLYLNRKMVVETLGIFVFPLAALSTLLPIGFNEHTRLPLELGSHVLISIAAYSTLGIATAQAILYSIQEKRFRKKQLSNLMRALPPLQEMENLMLKLLLIGFTMLSFALLSGIFFVEDLFAQHLIHKTFFAILSWLVYGWFIVGHYRYGWRGQKAVRYVIWAYLLLIVSFIGTELILHALYD